MRLSHAEARTWGIDVPKRQKYGAVKSGQFDSRHEARVVGELQIREKLGEIVDVRAHPVFLLFAARQFIGTFTPDACYRTLAGELIVIDAKQKHTRTEAYMLRKRIMKAIYGLDVVEVMQ